MSRVRGFEKALVTEKMELEGLGIKGDEQFTGLIMPRRETSKSAGYDFRAAEDTVIPSIWNHILGKTKLEVMRLTSSLRTAVTGDETKKVKYEDIKITPTRIRTGIKVYMQDDELLELHVRSSTPKRLGLLLANSVGIVDSDYYSNESNDGEIMFMVYNIMPFAVTVKKGDRFGQGIFNKYYITDDDDATRDRVGGVGSTNEQEVTG